MAENTHHCLPEETGVGWADAAAVDEVDEDELAALDDAAVTLVTLDAWALVLVLTAPESCVAPAGGALVVVGQLDAEGETTATTVAVSFPRAAKPVCTPCASNTGSGESSNMSSCAPSVKPYRSR